VHQLLIPGRTYDYFDMPTDAIGALIFVILFTILDRQKDKQARTS
jgi:VanZ family protein